MFQEWRFYSISMVTADSFQRPSDGMKPSWYFTCFGVVSKRPFNRSTPFSSIFASSSGYDRPCDDRIEHRVLVDQILEHRLQLLWRKLVAERF